MKETLKILFCDSGLGGLDVAAEFAAYVRLHGLAARRLEIIGFNAWPVTGYGYNQIPDTPSRIAAMRRAFAGMAALQPDWTVVACNTLSVLLKQDPDSSSMAPLPRLGITDLAADALTATLKTHPRAQIGIFGTLTTIGSELYPAAVAARGGDSRQLISIPCPGLATRLEHRLHEAQIAEEIRGYLTRFQAALPPGAEPWIALCCTHYGYALPVWQQEWARLWPDRPFAGLNFNALQARAIAQTIGGGAVPERITARMLSRIELTECQRSNVAPLLAARSPELAEALLHYTHDPDLFAVEPPPATR